MKFIFIILLLVVSLYSQEESVVQIELSSIIDQPITFAIDNENNYYILEEKRNKLIKINREGDLLFEIGGYGWGQLEFDNPISVATFDGLNIFVSDQYNNRIQRFNKNLDYISSLKTDQPPNIGEAYKYPTLIAVDRFMNLFVYDNENKRMLKYDNKNNLIKAFGGFNEYKGVIKNPKKINIGEEDEVLVLDDEGLKIFNNWGIFINEFILNKDILSVSTHKSSIYLLYDDHMDVIDKKGEVIKSQKLQNMLLEKSDELFVDMLIKSNRIHFLTNKNIFILPIY